ncbi:glutathione ABC transporter substrate-binding protein [Fusobacterium mortiferum]|uniref:glutathione ABC transporter substrate-binding protein n=1 Tax=Fusobacterium mortiferum TaxID=850 RepID=UPI001F1AB600|nr:glutathione ABC transporter substrate-binding protein [Fusobacterium mortiferum]MCF2699370.1 glutathione ABC transporter substrate-binding protein [Fusobacterium mortiferum]
MNKKLLVSSLVLSMLFLACGQEEKKIEKKDTLIVAQGADARSLDPQKAIDTPSVRVYQQVYDELVEKDDNLNIIPGLAESWENIDEKTTIFHLRKDVKFHNGEKLTAEDVKFSIERMKEQPTVAFLVTEIEKIEVVDEYTVKVITKSGFGPLLSHLSHPGAAILNKKAVLEKGDSYGQHPIGTGPYVFENWQSGDRVTLKANPDYFMGKTPVENVIFRVIPEGTNRSIALETKEVDIAYEIDPIDIDRIKENGEFNFLMQQSLGNAYIGINILKEPFTNPKVRQAMAYAINTQDLIDVVYKKTASKANAPIGPLVPGYNEKAKNYEYNIEKAKELMKEAGYPNGFKTTIWVNDNNIRKDIATILQDQFRAIGIDLTIETLEWGAYIDRTARGEHEMFLLGWVTVTGDADYGLYPLFHTSAHGRPGNRSFYSNLEVDKLLDFARTSTNQAERMEAYKKVQEIVQEDLPIITLVNQSQNVATQKDIENFTINPTGFYELYNVNFSENK